MKELTNEEFKPLMREYPDGGIVFEPDWQDDLGGIRFQFPAITTKAGAIFLSPDEDGGDFEWGFTPDDYPEDSNFLVYEDIDIIRMMERLDEALKTNKKPRLSLV